MLPLDTVPETLPMKRRTESTKRYRQIKKKEIP
jgi:hypothetical protein